MADGLKPDSTAGRAIGYRQAIMYLQHKVWCTHFLNFIFPVRLDMLLTRHTRQDRGKDQAFLQMLEDFMSSSR